MTTSIRAFGINKEITSNWIDLPETSKWLEERQIFPNVGDSIGLVGNDRALVGADSKDVSLNILVVKHRWVRHSIADIVIELEYQVR